MNKQEAFFHYLETLLAEDEDYLRMQLEPMSVRTLLPQLPTLDDIDIVKVVAYFNEDRMTINHVPHAVIIDAAQDMKGTYTSRALLNQAGREFIEYLSKSLLESKDNYKKENKKRKLSIIK